MGSYLVVDGRENNSKGISYPMINIMRQILPDKKSLFDGERSFTLEKDEVAKILYNLNLITRDDNTLKNFFETIDCYGLEKNESFEDKKETVLGIQNCFTDVLCCMILNYEEERERIICYWE